ncbi:MAG: restriction system protein [Frankiaceae bacterium]|jgi:hypothetical protein|nr:restriction system protein [Frankiaceae bacterium]
MDETVPRPLELALPLALTPRQFERYAADVLDQATPAVDDLRVTFNERISSHDGTYDIDATARFTFAGMDFLILVECKRHRHPIKREVVAALHDKIRSTGAQKGILFSTAPFQSGALRYAEEHGIALVHVTDAGPTYLVRHILSAPPESLASTGTPVSHSWRVTANHGLEGTLLDDNAAGVLDLLIQVPDRQ